MIAAVVFGDVFELGDVDVGEAFDEGFEGGCGKEFEGFGFDAGEEAGSEGVVLRSDYKGD